jgi:hypothetical protein
MDRLNWERTFPSTTEKFHNGIEIALDKIVMENYKAKKQMSIKTKVLLIAAAVIVLGGITANAAGLFKWDSRVAEEFNADEKQQDYLALKGLTEQKDVSATDNGLTIKLIQTVQDKNYIYIALDITTPEHIMIDNSNRFDSTHIQFGGISGGYGYSSSFLNKSRDDKPVNNKMYIVHIQKDPKTDVNGRDIILTFKNLVTNKKTVLEGEWVLSWTMHFNDSTRDYDLSQVYNMAGYEVLIKKVEITPLSITVYFKGDDLQKIEDDMEKDNKNRKVVERNNREGFFEIFDILRLKTVRGFKYKDGTYIQLETSHNGGRGSINKKTGEFSYTAIFDKIVNVEEIESVILGENETEIKLLD